MGIGQTLRRFVHSESSAGILLMAAAVLALLVSNLDTLSPFYTLLLDTPVVIKIGALEIAKPLLLWINDGLMAIFFLLVGLELKREVLYGQLASPSQITLPATAAVGGMLVPALLYWLLNQDNPAAAAGWAIPMATDIAFALGVLALLGSRIPASLKLFLMTLAIIDDLGAIIVIALFYSGQLSSLSIILAAIAIAGLVLLNRFGVRQLGPYLVIGICLWVCVLKSGVHATLAGVVLALTIPANPDDHGHSPLHSLEHALHGWVAFFILPLFAFANAGVSLAGMSLGSLLEPITLGIIIGLVAGKTLGVLGMTALTVGLGWARLPKDSTWLQLLGVALLCGIGFTMSLFVGSLAFPQGQSPYAGMDRLGILSASLIAALFGYLLLRLSSNQTAPSTP